jgi:aryl-alcohol dehydrogenase-like predicted oxidoreductase
MHRLGVSLLAYSPLGFGALTGKYDDGRLDAPATVRRLALFERMKQQRWAAPRRWPRAPYNALARAHGLTPTRMALAFCYTSWRVASTIIGVTTRRSSTRTSTPGARRCRPSCWRRSTRSAGAIRDPAQ